MRWLLITLSLVAATDAAFAHGGGAFNGPPPGYWKRGIPCSCAKIECDKCATQALRDGKDISRCRTKVTELKRWGDIAQLRITVTLETKRKQGSVEGYVRLQPAPVFAAVSGSIQSFTTSSKAPHPVGLKATLRGADEARRTYLWERRRFSFDPLLVLRRGPGEVHARMFPISKLLQTHIVIDGYALLARSDIAGVRLYRTGQRYMAVGRHGMPEFLSEDECRARYGTGVAVVVPCVPQLETAVTGRGTAAAGDDVALAAFPARAKLPPFVGPDVWVPFALPPRQAADPEPPPPPPAEQPRTEPPPARAPAASG